MIDDTMKLESIPITSSQRLILTGQLLQPNEPLYNMVMVFNIKGAVVEEYFNQAFDTLVKNCDAMRTIFTDLNDAPKQFVLASIDYQLLKLDFSADADPYSSYKQWEVKRARINFDLTKCLFDSALIKLSNNNYIWYFNKHHIVTDAWSTGVIYQYLQSCYGLAKRGKLEQVEPLPLFSNYAQQELTQQSSKRFYQAKEYWDEKLKTPVKASKFYRPVPKKKSAITKRYTCELGLERTNRLRALISDSRFMAFSTDLGLMQLFSTILFTYLYRMSGVQSLAIGTPNHSRTTKGLKQTAGLLINIFPLQVELTEDETFVTLYEKVAKANQELLIHAVPGANQAAHNHAFDVVLNYIPSTFGEFDGIEMKSNWVHPDSGDRNHLLRLQVHNFDKKQNITLLFDLNIDAFQQQETQWVSAHFIKLLDTLIENPNCYIDRIPLLQQLSDQAINQQGQSNHGADTPFPNDHVLALFKQCAQDKAEQVALVLGETNISFSDLDKHSDLVAHYLIEQGWIGEHPIAVCLDRSIESVLAIMGILKAGAAFLPVDINYPKSRIQYLISNAKTSLIITCNKYLARLVDIPQPLLLIDKDWGSIVQTPVKQTLPTLSPSDPAYIIYTSGSTGHPKGVKINHGGLFNYLSWAKQYYLAGGCFDFPLFSSLSFDLTITSLFLPLISGGRLVIYPESEDNLGITIRNVIEDNRVDIIKLTPAHLTLIQNMDFSTSTLKKLIVGGDDFKTELAFTFNKYFAGNIEIYNEYGPTEATVACTVHKYVPAQDSRASVPIGTPIKNASVYLLDKYLNPVPQGVVGEIYIAGAGLADGYLDQSELTAERFIFHPNNSQLRLYKTGDLATYSPQGVIEYLGRNDHQVKVRGVRIETGEIEAALLSLPNVKDCIVDISAHFGLQGTQETLELEVAHCAKCGLAANHPSAQLNEQKVCRICLIYDKQSALAQAYFKDLPTLQSWINRIKQNSKGKQDSIMLLSGGKDSSYTLCKLVDMGLTPLVFTLDNGYISDGAKANIKRLVDRLGLELVIGKTEAMDDIFVDSLTRFSNVCNGCFKTIYTMSMKLARERGISVICTGLSRGQIFETRVAHLFQQGCFSPEKIDQRIVEARKAYHRTDDIISRSLDVQFLQDDEIFEQIQYLDYFRYTNVTLDEMYDYLNNVAPWIRPSDTGRSTNCLINDAGIYVHKKERGYHNYALPYSWDVRLGHKEREAALDELDDEIDQQKVNDILKRVGYQYQKPNTQLSREDVLVAYYSCPAEIPKNILQKHLASALPSEYIPTQFIWLNAMPLSTNGKIDRQALPKPQQSTRELTVDYIAPSSEVETTLVSLWNKLLGVKEIGIADNFFDLGGDSIVNIQIVAAAREYGIDISPQQIFDYPTIQELAKVAGIIKVYKAEQGKVTGRVELLPIQKRFFESTPISPNQYVQSVTLQYTDEYSKPVLEKAFQALVKQHDGLRSRFLQTDSGWQQEILPNINIHITEAELHPSDNLDDVISKHRALLIAQLDISLGKLFGAVRIVNIEDNKSFLLIVIHHLVVDGVSWWVLLGDLAKCCKQITQQQEIKLAPKSCSVMQWSEASLLYATSPKIEKAKDYWVKQLTEITINSANQLSNQHAITSVFLTELETLRLSHEVPAAFNVQVPDLLLAALANCKQWFSTHAKLMNESGLLVDIEGHGREDIIDGLDIMRTVAWFTSIYPIILKGSPGDLGRLLKTTKEQIRQVPNRGIDYGMLRYSVPKNSTTELLASAPKAQILFNYMGHWERTLDTDSPFSFVQPISAHNEDNSVNHYALEINTLVFDKQLRIDLTYDSALFSSDAMSEFAKLFKQTITDLIQYCIQQKGKGFTPSDFPSAGIDQDDLEDLFAEFGED